MALWGEEAHAVLARLAVADTPTDAWEANRRVAVTSGYVDEAWQVTDTGWEVVRANSPHPGV